MNYKGIQINPSEIENVIESIPGVKLVAVVGILDPVVQNLATAVIVKQPGYESITETQIINFVAENLPEHKQIHGGVYFVDEMPTTLSGKVKKRVVLDMIFERSLQVRAEKIQEAATAVQVSDESERKRRTCCCFF